MGKKVVGQNVLNHFGIEGIIIIVTKYFFFPNLLGILKEKQIWIVQKVKAQKELPLKLFLRKENLEILLPLLVPVPGGGESYLLAFRWSKSLYQTLS